MPSFTQTERRASFGLASVFSLRMFGLFVILPVVALYADALPGGSSAILIGLAVGIYGLTQAILDELPKQITIMHPGPINRGVEISSEVADGQNSIILNQVENGVAIRMAVIYLLASQIER